MVVIYKLTSIGEALAHNPRAERTPGRLVLYHLSKYGSATAEQLYHAIPGLTSMTLAKLVKHRIIFNNAEISAVA